MTNDGIQQRKREYQRRYREKHRARIRAGINAWRRRQWEARHPGTAYPAQGLIYKYDDAVLRAVDDFWKARYRPPSLQDLMDACGITSKSVARAVVKRLARKKLLVTSNAIARAIVPVWIVAAIDAAVSTNGALEETKDGHDKSTTYFDATLYVARNRKRTKK